MRHLILAQMLFGAVAIAHGADLNTKVEAKRLIERVSGTKLPEDHPLIAKVESNIKTGDWLKAADVALTHPGFLNVTVKQMALKMSTREESYQIEFNDFAAMFMGVVRDDLDARQLLTGNFFYMGDASKAPTGITVRSEYDAHLTRSNQHYQDLDDLRLNIAALLVKVTGQLQLQSSTNAIVYNPDPAGLLTTRAFMSAHAIAGTNRRPVEYTFREFLCAPIESWSDISSSDARIGRDIDRHPGGDHSKFQVSCKGCHTGMDGFRGAFAKWDVNGQVTVNRDAQLNGSGMPLTGVVGKLNQNASVFPSGFVTTDNSFVNNARGPANEIKFGWRGAAEGGYGVKDFGRIVSESRRFSECMVVRVYQAVCRKPLSIEGNEPYVRFQASRFETNNYSLKKLFANVAVTRECVE